MQPSSSSSKRNKTLLIAAAGVLALVFIVGAVLMRDRQTGGQANSTLAGEALIAAETADLAGEAARPLNPSWLPGMNTGFERKTYRIRPAHVGADNRWLTSATWGIEAYGLMLWQWDDSKAWRESRIWTAVREEGSDYFRFYLELEETNSRHEKYKAKNYMAVFRASVTPGAEVVTFADPGGHNHLWRPTLINEEHQLYMLQVKSSGLCLDIKDSANADGARAIQQTCDPNSASQWWYFEEIEPY